MDLEIIGYRSIKLKHLNRFKDNPCEVFVDCKSCFLENVLVESKGNNIVGERIYHMRFCDEEAKIETKIAVFKDRDTVTVSEIRKTSEISEGKTKVYKCVADVRIVGTQEKAKTEYLQGIFGEAIKM